MTAASETAALQPTVTVSPWKYAASPIGYRGRLWFAAANKWPDHNSADIWSMEPGGTDVRKERRLFSQDVGQPIIHRGLLYWPLEDPRVSLGWGQIAVTNGMDWRVLESRVGRQFHMHGLFTGTGSRILAAASAWSAQVLKTDDGGASWSTLFEAPREEKRFSRTYQLVQTTNGLFGDLIKFGNGPRSFGMLQFHADTAAPLAGWPEADGLVRRAIRWRNGVLVLRGLGEAQELVTPGNTADPAIQLPENVIAIDLDGGSRIWLLGKTAQGDHGLWQHTDGRWERRYHFIADEALTLRLVGGEPVVTGSLNGLATIWGRPGEISSEPAADLPNQITNKYRDASKAKQQLADALADPRSYVGHGLGLRNVIDRWVIQGLSGEVLSQYLAGPFPEGEVRLIGGRTHASHERFGRWLLTWGMRRAGGGTVPVSWLRANFDEPINDSAKYFSEPVAAIWTAAAVSQTDRVTMTVLRARAIDRDQPDWLRIDYEAAFELLDRKQRSAAARQEK